MGEGYFDFYELRNDEKAVGDSVFAALDLETTGLYSEIDSIVEIGIITFKAWSVVDRFHSLINPGRVIPEEVVRIHGIDDEMVAEQPCIRDMLPQIKNFLGDAVVIAHNASFDLGFLSAAAERAEFDLKIPSWIDTCDLAKKSFPGLSSYSLQNLAARFGIDTGRAHRAVDDAEICMKLFEIECEKIGGKELQTADIIRMTEK